MPSHAIDDENYVIELSMLANDLKLKITTRVSRINPLLTEITINPTTSAKIPPLYAPQVSCLPCDTLKKTAFCTSLTPPQRRKIERYLARQISRHGREIRDELKKVKAKMEPNRATFSKKSFCEIYEEWGQYIKACMFHNDLYDNWALDDYEKMDSVGASFEAIMDRLVHRYSMEDRSITA